jgi:hypothetical protein
LSDKIYLAGKRYPIWVSAIIDGNRRESVFIMLHSDTGCGPTTAETQMVPIIYAGLWIVWSQQGTRIEASGHTLQQAALAAAASGETLPIFAKAPKAGVRFAGHQR